MAVCSFCRSTVVRDGDTLRRIGQLAALFDDHTPLQLGVSGRYQGAAFTLVGRLQWRAREGLWNEWHALFDTGRSGWLSEDNGQYVFSFDGPTPDTLPNAVGLNPGAALTLAGTHWSVAARVKAHIESAEGELPTVPGFDAEHTVVELRNAQGEVASWAVISHAAPTAPDPATSPPHWSLGRSVQLAKLDLHGLKDESNKTLKGRAIECPSCGTSLTPTLDSTQSLVCHQCKAVVDISQGVGADLKFFAQAGNPDHPIDGSGAAPLIALGSTGTLVLSEGQPEGEPPLAWQVVGYMERCEIPDDPHDDQTYWREYLLYHRTAGFAFLVDSEDGWSWVRPISGAPKTLGAERVAWASTTYRKKFSYHAKTTWVLGEFYWPVSRDQRSHNTDYEGTGAGSHRRLSREATGDEVTWSAGATLSADAVRQAFRLPPAHAARMRRDTTATSSLRWFSLPMFFVVLLILVMVMAIARCSRDDCDGVRQTFGSTSAEYQQCRRQGGYRSGGSGGSFGGFSSGGSHK